MSDRQDKAEKWLKEQGYSKSKPFDSKKGSEPTLFGWSAVLNLLTDFSNGQEKNGFPEKVDFNSKEYHITHLESIVRKIPKRKTKGVVNCSIVMDYILNSTSYGGMTSACDYCHWIGIDPYGYEGK